MDMSKALADIEFRNRENMISHLPYDREMAFYKSIQSGNIEKTHELFKPLSSEGLGTLSEDALQNLKYHLVITVAFITRYCIEGGMEMETAYNLSDIYIRRIDKCKSNGDVNAIHIELVDDYLTRMNTLLKKATFSRPVMVCIDYIYDHLHAKITLDELADACALSRSHLSRLFAKEVGVTISRYINEKKAAAARGLLEYSEYTVSDIANFLCFSSESHFIAVFRQHTGFTPGEYRKRYFRTSGHE